MRNKRENEISNLIMKVKLIAVITMLVIVSRLVYKQILDYSRVSAATLAPEQIELEDVTDIIEADYDSQYMGNTVSDDELNIVVMGDSIWDYYRDDENVGSLVEMYLQENFPYQSVHVYNLSIGGTSASLSSDATTDMSGWNHNNITGVTYALTGMIEDTSFLEEQAMYNILPEVDIDKIDYFIISYGLNDYFCGRPVTSEDKNDQYSYVGAIEDSVSTLHSYCPDARFLIMSPTYCQFYYYEEVESTCLDRDYGGGGTLDKYVAGAESAALEYGLLYQNAFSDYDLGADTQFIYTRDGVHFNTPGREKYASQVADFLTDDYGKILGLDLKEDLLIDNYEEDEEETTSELDIGD